MEYEAKYFSTYFRIERHGFWSYYYQRNALTASLNRMIDIVSDGGTAGEEVVFAGIPQDMSEHGDTITAKFLRK